MPIVIRIGAALGRAGRVAAASIVVGQLVICAITTESNIRGIDASWFNAAATIANVLWLPPLLLLTVLSYRRGTLPRPLAVGLAVAYIGTIPLAINGGGLLAAAYWAMVGTYLSRNASRPGVVNPSTEETR
jgi:hypothetical protein